MSDKEQKKRAALKRARETEALKEGKRRKKEKSWANRVFELEEKLATARRMLSDKNAEAREYLTMKKAAARKAKISDARVEALEVKVLELKSEIEDQNYQIESLNGLDELKKKKKKSVLKVKKERESESTVKEEKQKPVKRRVVRKDEWSMRFIN